ncbi:MAG: NADH-quinone oxidoreductase subunit J [Myxococcales bacterium]|nr:NADH-quinone oxidoreductase subunit J [Myxococcales bacterium]
MAQLAFGLVAAAMLGSGLLAVRSRNLVHAVLWLAVSLIATAAAYVLLSAPFLAAMQILLYTGGVVTLMLFGVMLTDHRHDGGAPGRLSNDSAPQRPWLGAFFAAALFGVVAAALYQTPLPVPAAALDASTARLGELVLGDHLVAFEAISVLLLAALLGAVALARKTDP